MEHSSSQVKSGPLGYELYRHFCWFYIIFFMLWEVHWISGDLCKGYFVIVADFSARFV
jgi:hypothetical protein